MMRFVIGFGVLGFLAALVVGLTGDAELSSVLRAAGLWAVSFAVLGLFLGKTAMVLLGEAGIGELKGTDPGGEAENGLSGEGMEEGKSNGEFSSGDSTDEPIRDDEASTAPGV